MDHGAPSSVGVHITSFGPFLNVTRNPSQDVMEALGRRIAATSSAKGLLHVASTRVIHVTPAAVDGALADIKRETAAAASGPAIVLHIGVARVASWPRLELVGINDLHCPAGDADGDYYHHAPIASDSTLLRDGDQALITASCRSSIDGDVSSSQTPLPPGRGWLTPALDIHAPVGVATVDFCQRAAAGRCTAAEDGDDADDDGTPVLAMSYDAGGYLCNYTLFQSLRRLASPPARAVGPSDADNHRDVGGVNAASRRQQHHQVEDLSTAPVVLPLFVHIAPAETMDPDLQARSILRFLTALVKESAVFSTSAAGAEETDAPLVSTVALFTTAVDLPCHPDRRRLVHALIQPLIEELFGANDADGPPLLLRNPLVHSLRDPAESLQSALASVHGSAYLTMLASREGGRRPGGKRLPEALMDAIASGEEIETTASPRREPIASDSDDEEYGLVDDATPYAGMWRDAVRTADGTHSAAAWLAEQMSASPSSSSPPPVAMHWEGGRHHAGYDRAGGFCFVNDVAVAARLLHRGNGQTSRRRRVLVADFDAHHGDGTEFACLGYGADVFTLSMHVFRQGVYPGTGDPELSSDLDRGVLNLGLPPGATDATAVPLWQTAVKGVVDRFDPDVVVAVCGCDAVAGDPLGHLSLSVRGACQLFTALIDTGRPMLCLGAGGYVDRTAARCYSLFTAMVLARGDGGEEGGSGLLRRAVEGASEDLLVPDTCGAFAAFAPTFSLFETPRSTEYCDPVYAAELAAANACVLRRLQGDQCFSSSTDEEGEEEEEDDEEES